MGMKFGIDGKLYYCAAGIGGAPSWTELLNVKDVTLNLEKGEAEVTTRSNGKWRATGRGGPKDASVEFEMAWNPTDAGFTVLKDAWLNDALVGIAVMDGDVAVAGAEGLWADCAVVSFSRSEPLEEGMTVSVTMKPTDSANAPQWKVVAA